MSLSLRLDFTCNISPLERAMLAVLCAEVVVQYILQYNTFNCEFLVINKPSRREESFSSVPNFSPYFHTTAYIFDLNFYFPTSYGLS